MKRIGGIFEGFLVIPTKLIKGEFALIVYNVYNHKLPISSEYYNRIYVQRNTFFNSPRRRMMEQQWKWNFDGTWFETIWYESKYWKIYFRLIELGEHRSNETANFPFTLLEIYVKTRRGNRGDLILRSRSWLIAEVHYR